MSSPRFLGSPPIRRPVQVELERATPSVHKPSGKAIAVTSQSSEAYTFFTKAGEEQQMYTGDRSWGLVTLELQTAGPVVVGPKQGIIPVASGKGVLLTTNVPRQFVCPKGTRLWIAATAVNRVSVLVEPFAWSEQQLGAINDQVAAEGSVIAAINALPAQLATALINAMRGKR